MTDDRDRRCCVWPPMPLDATCLTARYVACSLAHSMRAAGLPEEPVVALFTLTRRHGTHPVTRFIQSFRLTVLESARCARRITSPRMWASVWFRRLRSG